MSTYHKRYSQSLGMDNQILAYIQFRVLKMTLESMSFDYRQGLQSEVTEERLPPALDGNSHGSNP